MWKCSAAWRTWPNDVCSLVVDFHKRRSRQRRTTWNVGASLWVKRSANDSGTCSVPSRKATKSAAGIPKRTAIRLIAESCAWVPITRWGRAFRRLFTPCLRFIPECRAVCGIIGAHHNHAAIRKARGYITFSHFQSSVLMMVRGWRCVPAHAGPACFALGETRQGFAFISSQHAACPALPGHQTQSRPVPESRLRCVRGARAAGQAGARGNAFQRLRWACGP